MIKKILKKLYRFIIYRFFFIIYKKPKLLLKTFKDLPYKIFSINIKNNKYYLFKIINGRVYTNTIDDTAYISENYLLNEPSFQYRNSINSHVKNNICLKIGTPRFLKNVKGKVLSLLAGGGANVNYHHWLFDVLPRLYLYKKMQRLSTIDFILVPNFKLEFQKTTLKILGFSKNKILDSARVRHLAANQLYATSHPRNHDTSKICKWHVQFLKKYFLKPFIKNKFINEKIYLDRGEGFLLKNSNWHNLKDNYRLIVNEDEVKSFLLSKGFKIIKSQDLSFLEQVNLFSNLRCLVTLHGAGLSNLVFCRANTKVIEIRTLENSDIFPKVLSKLCNLQYYSISLKTIYKSRIDQNGLMFCPTAKIDQALRNLNVI